MVAVAPITPSLSAGGLAAPAGLPENPSTGLGAPQGDVAAFDRALAHPPSEQRALPVPDTHGFGAELSARAESLSLRLGSLHPPNPSGDLQGARVEQGERTPGSLTDAMREAISGLQGSYAFAIEATLASRGSTEATKIVNTLLKGQ